MYIYPYTLIIIDNCFDTDSLNTLHSRRWLLIWIEYSRLSRLNDFMEATTNQSMTAGWSRSFEAKRSRKQSIMTAGWSQSRLQSQTSIWVQYSFDNVFNTDYVTHFIQDHLKWRAVIINPLAEWFHRSQKSINLSNPIQYW